MTETTPPPAPPTNAAEASSRLASLTADKAWADKLLANTLIENYDVKLIG